MNRRFQPAILLSAAVLTIGAGCNRVPDGVIPPEDMALLMADTYMGEGVVDMNSNRFPSDSSRMLLKQSIYAAHGVSRQKVDTSFVWYGNNIEEYIKVLERTEEILKDRKHQLAVTSSRQLSLSGDSVNVWAGAERITVGGAYPQRFITFAITPDTTWHSGDSYTLRYKLVNGRRPVDARVCVDYDGGITKVYNAQGRSQGITELRFRIDPERTPARMYGYIDLNPRPSEHFHLDSIALIRTRKSEFSHFYTPSGMELHWKNYSDKTPSDTSEVQSVAASPSGSTAATRSSASRLPQQAPATIDIPPATIGPQRPGRPKR